MKYFRLSLYLSILILISVNIFSGCQTLRKMNEPENAELAKYIRYIEARTNTKVTYPTIFERSEDLVAGICFTWHEIPLYIVINSFSWEYFTENERIGLLFHEIGHCSFGLPHFNESFSDGCPISFMNELTTLDACIRKRGLEYYINEMIEQIN